MRTLKSIRLLTSVAGDRWSAIPGEVIQVGGLLSQEEAQRFVERGLAEIVEESAAPERPAREEFATSYAAREDASQRPARGRR